MAKVNKNFNKKAKGSSITKVGKKVVKKAQTSNRTKKTNKTASVKSQSPLHRVVHPIKTTDINKLNIGNCTCIIEDSFGRTRKSNGYVDKIPYSQNATKEMKEKLGENLIYVIHYNDEKIKQYIQPELQKFKTTKR